MSEVHDFRAVDDRDEKIAALNMRVAGLENELRKARTRAFYAEGEAREAAARVCPMSLGDPHAMCALAEGLSDALARACERHPDLQEWLEETAEPVGEA
jgi:hypothetical protein